MPFEQTITIINNSGKIISTGKHLVGIFKEARTAYREKKEALKQERSGNFCRERTFHVAPDVNYQDYHGPIVEEFDDDHSYDEYHGDSYRQNHRSLRYSRGPLYLDTGLRRLSLDNDERRSQAPSTCSRSTRLRRSNTASDAFSDSGRARRVPPRPPLTASNLRTFTEVSATSPSAAPRSYLKNADLRLEPASCTLTSQTVQNEHTRGHCNPDSPLSATRQPPSRQLQPESLGAMHTESAHALTPRTSLMVHRPWSDPALDGHVHGSRGGSSHNPIDMHLAYGDVPPDLASRDDLEGHLPSSNEKHEAQKEAQARTLVSRIESLLNEAQCIHHTAASIIFHLQDNPEAAAAVALTLAELSALLAKLSPAFLGVVKGGSPAVFALLASPQFLIGTGIAVGITVVIFGGWKIIKRISEVRPAHEAEVQAVDMDPLPQVQEQRDQARTLLDSTCLTNSKVPTLASGGFDEALVLEEELSTIETWRRGIVQPLGSDGVVGSWEGTEVDVELISPEAMRSRIGDEDDRTLRSVRRRRATKTQGDLSRSGRNSRHSISQRDGSFKGKNSKGGDSSLKVPERHGSRDFQGGETSDSRSQTDQHHSHGHRDQHWKHVDGTANEASSVKTTRSHHGRRSYGHGYYIRSGKGSDGISPSEAAPSGISTVSSKERRIGNGGSMLKQLFKKNRVKDSREHEDTVLSVLV